MSPTSPRQPAAAGAGGARHAAFKVHRDSHTIHKAAATSPPSSSSTNSSVSSSSPNSRRPPPAPALRHKPPPPPQMQQPVIIYTHSPKVIRTNPRDFMSIVQKLTGLDSPGGPGPGPARAAAPPPPARVTAATAAAAQDESSSSSSESCAANSHAAGPPPPPPPYADSQLMPPPPPLDAHFLAPDIPLFAPDAASELQQLCAAPRGLYGQFPPPVDAAALGPVMAASVHGGAGAGTGGAVSFSPSMVEAMRGFPDYN
ncbi:unnamed protein product [Urochloa humidicola]